MPREIPAKIGMDKLMWGSLQIHQIHSERIRLSDGPDGKLYGTAHDGWGYELYSINKDGSEFSVIQSNLASPSFVITTNGWIYSLAIDPTFEIFGTNSNFVRFGLDGTDYTVLTEAPPEYGFLEAEGPSLFLGNDGAFYGMDVGGGVFRIKDFKGKDFDHFETGDWIFQNARNQLEVWFMDGTNKLGSVLCHVVHPARADQRFVAMEQLDNNGRSAIIWQEQTFRVLWATVFNGTNVERNILLSPQFPEFEEKPQLVFARPHFPGSPGLMIQNANGSVSMWLTNTPKMSLGGPGNSTKPRLFDMPYIAYAGGLSDCQNDGREDLIMQEPSGEISVWLMDGLTVMRVLHAKDRVPKGGHLMGSAELYGGWGTQFIAAVGSERVDSSSGDNWYSIYSFFSPYPRIVGVWNFGRADNDGVILQARNGSLSYAPGIYSFSAALTPERGTQWLGVVK